jgi:peptidylprolyl isomerase
MTKAASGDTVRVHYTGKLGSGEVFDSSEGRDPLQFEVGAGNVIAGFDSAIIGMSPGDKKDVDIPVDDAYGSKSEEMVLEIGREQLPDGMDPQVGQWLQVGGDDGRVGHVRVAAVGADSITIDGNHPLAGEDLHFEIELVEIM